MNATVKVDPALKASISVSSAKMDLNQSFEFTGTASGGTGSANYTYGWQVNGMWISSASMQLTYIFNPGKSGTYTVSFVLNDTGVSVDGIPLYDRHFANATVSVYVDPSVTALPSSATMDVGEYLNMTSSVLNGTGQFTYQWFVNGTPEGGNTPYFNFTPTGKGNYTINLTVTDSGTSVGAYPAIFAKSNIANIRVNAEPEVTISPSSVKMDLGQSISLYAVVNGGTGPFDYVWFLNGTNSGTITSTYTFDPSGTGSYTFDVRVTDTGTSYLAKPIIAVTSQSITVTVYADPSVTITPSSGIMDLNQTLEFVPDVTGGTGSFSYMWFVNGAVTGVNTTDYNFTPLATGNYTIYVKITDTGASPHATPIITSTSNVATIKVLRDPVVSIYPMNAVVDGNQSVNFTASVTGGSGMFEYYWEVKPLVDPPQNYFNGTFPYLNFSFANPGAYNVSVYVEDNGTGSATPLIYSNMARATVTVDRELSVKLSNSSVKMDLNQSFQFGATISNGTGQYSYGWMVNGFWQVSYADSTTFTFTPLSPGIYNVTFVGNDTGVSLFATPKYDQHRAYATVAVYKDPSIVISPSLPEIMDVGQVLNVTSSAGNGTGQYDYVWYLNASLTNITTPYYVFSPRGIGNYIIHVNVTDVGTTPGATPQITVASSILKIRVYASIAVSVGPSSAVMDLNQSLQFNARISGGTGSYSYGWMIDGVWQPHYSGSLKLIFTPANAGTYNITFVGNDSGVSQNALPLYDQKISSVTVTVNRDPNVAITPSSSVTMDVGQYLNITSLVTYGTGPFAFSWYLDGRAVSVTTDYYNFTPSSPENVTIYVLVTDTGTTPGAVPEITAMSSVLSVTVYSGVSIVKGVASGTLDLGQSVELSVGVTGGTGHYGFAWYENGSVLSGQSAQTFNFTPTGLGTYSVKVVVFDTGTSSYAKPIETASSSATIKVEADPFVSISIVNDSPSSTVSLDAGQSITFLAKVTGGSGTFDYLWYVNGNATISTGSQFNFTRSLVGNYSVKVRVTDVGVMAGATPLMVVFSAKVNIRVYSYPSLTISPTEWTMDVGQTLNITTTVHNGTGDFSYVWYQNGSRISNAAKSYYIFDPAGAGKYSFNVSVTDLTTVGSTPKVVLNSSVTIVVVNSKLAASISLNQSTLDVGQTTYFSLGITGGTSPYTWSLELNGSSSNLTGASLSPSLSSFKPGGVGTYTLYFNVTDHVGETSDVSATLKVYSDPIATVTTTSVNTDVGLSFTADGSISGGYVPIGYYYYYAWTVGDSIPPSSLTNSSSGTVSTTLSPSALKALSNPGTYDVYLWAIDLNGKIVVSSNYITVIVNPLPEASITLSKTTIDVTQSTTVTLSIVGGTSPYTWTFEFNGSGNQSGASLSPFTFTPKGVGTYTLYFNVTDNVGETSKATAKITVNTLPSITISPTSSTIDVSQGITFTNITNGGTSPYTWSYTVNATSGYSISGNTITFTTAGSYEVTITVKDAAGETASASSTVKVNPELTVTITGNPSTMDVGQSATLTASVSGGTSPYTTYAWIENASAAGKAGTSVGTGSTFQFTPSGAGTYTFYVNVTDSASVPFTATSSLVTIIVYQAPRC